MIEYSEEKDYSRTMNNHQEMTRVTEKEQFQPLPVKVCNHT